MQTELFSWFNNLIKKQSYMVYLFKVLQKRVFTIKYV
jgi:hypothetical protein